MGKGILGKDGWETTKDATPTRGTLTEVNAANNKLVKENKSLREELKDKNEQISGFLDLVELNDILVGQEIAVTGQGFSKDGVNVPFEEMFKIEPEEVGNAVRQADIREALTLLEIANNDQWTDTGLPRVEAVCAIMEDDSVTRAEIEEALPGFNRTPEKG